MLDALGSIFNNYGLFIDLPSDQSLYRVRACSDDEVFESFESMGVPPIGIASGGRMNPAGISYFYLAREKKTAKKEVLFKETSYYLGTFKNISPLKLINFSDLPSAPSPFEENSYDIRHAVRFLHCLKEDIIKPVSKDGREHIDYIPTQIISEYFRYRFKDKDGNHVDGFIYPSVKNDGGTNIVIFDSDNTSLESKFSLVKTKKFE